LIKEQDRRDHLRFLQRQQERLEQIEHSAEVPASRERNGILLSATLSAGSGSFNHRQRSRDRQDRQTDSQTGRGKDGDRDNVRDGDRDRGHMQTHRPSEQCIELNNRISSMRDMRELCGPISTHTHTNKHSEGSYTGSYTISDVPSNVAQSQDSVSGCIQRFSQLVADAHTHTYTHGRQRQA
jgi:hypothetical protein